VEYCAVPNNRNNNEFDGCTEITICRNSSNSTMTKTCNLKKSLIFLVLKITYTFKLFIKIAIIFKLFYFILQTNKYNYYDFWITFR